MCPRSLSREQAGAEALRHLEERFGTDRAGLIAVDANGNISTAFHTAGMGRAWMRASDRLPTVRVWPRRRRCVLTDRIR